MTRRLVLMVTLCTIATASAAYAHHSHPYFYDECKPVTIEGRVEKVEFKDPHSLIFLKLDDGAAYTVDWAPLSRLTTQGVIGPAKEALVFGARVAVTGNRIRTTAEIRQHFPDFTGVANQNTLDPISIRRVGDGFSWALPPRKNPPNCAGQGQGQGRPAFEAATIKLAAPDAVRNRVILNNPTRVVIPSMTLTALVYAAYGDGGFNTAMSVRGGPDWANRTAFAVEGIASGPATARQRRLMLQTLLAERFALKVRNDTQTGTALTLVVDRSDGTLGAKVKTWSGTCPQVRPVLYFEAPWLRPQNGQTSESDDPQVPYCPTGYRAGGITIDGATMAAVAEMLSLPPARALLGTITHDRTGLSGRYTMARASPFPATGPAAGAASEFAGPSLPTAIRDQWGLRVVPGEGTLKVIVIENAQLPTAN